MLANQGHGVRAQSDAEHERRLLRAVLEAMTEGVTISDEDADVLDMNAEALRLHGFEDVEQVRRNIKAWPDFELRTLDGHLVPVEDWPLARVTKGETFTDYQLRVRNLTTGVERIWSYSGSPVIEGGGIVRTVMTFRDVTEEHAAREAIERAEHYGRSLNRVNEAINQNQDFDQLIETVLNIVAAATRADVGVVFTPLPEQDGWLAKCVTNAPLWLRNAIVHPADIPFSARAAHAMRAMVFNEPERAEGWDGSVAQRLGATAVLDAPLPTVGDAVGDLALYHQQPDRQFTEDDADFLAKAITAFSLAVQRLQLLHDRTEEAQYAKALNRINDIMHSSLDFEQILHRAVVEATKAAKLDASAVHVREAGGWRFAYSYGLPAKLREMTLSDEQAPLSMRILGEQRPLALADASEDPRANQQLMSRFGIKALVGVPLVVRGESIGVLFAGCFGLAGRLSERQIDFLTKVASTVSSALENARSFESERRVADTLQEALLQVPERLPGIEFAHSYHSASEAARVGGDFYDIFEMEHHRIGIVVGDVAGKGLEAAMLTSLAKNSIRAHADEKGAAPAQILRLTNALLYRTTASEIFVTVFFGVLDCASGTLTYANAGHTSGAVVTSRGVHALPATGPILGAFESAEVKQEDVVLGEEDLLFLYTDGLIEASREREQLGEERVFRMLEQLPSVMPSAAVRRAIEDVLAFTEGHLSDDLALLSVKRANGSEEAHVAELLHLPGDQ